MRRLRQDAAELRGQHHRLRPHDVLVRVSASWLSSAGRWRRHHRATHQIAASSPAGAATSTRAFTYLQECNAMAEVLVQIRGTLYDLASKSSRQVLLQGDASLVGLGVGGGPIYPPEGGGPGEPPGIWGGGNVPMPTPPIANVPGAPGYRPPGIWGGGNEPFPTPPIWLPPGYPGAGPPSVQPPEPPQPGSPPTPVPPPEGSGGWPVAPITPPPYIVVHYPGIGPVTVPQPLTAQPK